MENLDPFAVKNRSQYSSQSPSLNQIQQTQKQSNQWNNSSNQYSTHDFDIFLKPTQQQSSPAAAPPPTFATVPPTTTNYPSHQSSTFDPFFDSKFGSNSQSHTTSHSAQSFDPFVVNSTPSRPAQHSQFSSNDPFFPSFPPTTQSGSFSSNSFPAFPQSTQQSTSSPSTAFDPFAPFPSQSTSQTHAAATPAPSSSQFDVDFDFLNQSRPTVQKQFSLAEESIDLDWSTPNPPPVPPLNTTTSGDVDDALAKLRQAYGLHGGGEDMDGSNHGDDDWPMSPRYDTHDRHPAPVIGKPPMGRYSHSGASHSPYPVDEKTVVTAEDLNLPSEGVLLARLSVRSLVTKDWAPIFWIFSTNHHRRPLHFDEDPLSLLIYRSKDDYEHNPLGTMIKKEIPIRMNLACIPIRRKEYKGYGMLFYFMLEEHTEMGSVPVIKFASANRDDVDVLWINLKARINAAKRKAVKTLVDSRQV